MPPVPLSTTDELLRLIIHLVEGEEKGKLVAKLSEITDTPPNTLRNMGYHMTEAQIVKNMKTLLEKDDSISPLAHKMRIREFQKKIQAEQKNVRDLIDELEQARAIREDILGIAEPIYPEKLNVERNRKPHGMTWAINLFDNHLGKRFDEHEVQGLQAYDVEIAKNRIKRTFQQSIQLMNRYGEPIERIIVVCGGDNTNGELRNDDTASNEINCAEQSREFAEAVCDGLETLLAEYECNIDVLVLPGNHGRTKPNPPSVDLGENWDCVAGMLIEAAMKTEPRVKISNSGVADAVLEIYGRAYLWTHGDRIGARGGDGIIGALGPTRRGALRMFDQYSQRRHYLGHLAPLHGVVMGHWHTHWTDRRVFVSGAACGPDPWALNSLRATPTPPWQWLIGFHPTKAIIQETTLFVGHPDEGAICADFALTA